MDPARPGGKSQAGKQAHAGHGRSAGDHTEDDPPIAGSESHADADLPAPLQHGLGDQAVQARRRERHHDRSQTRHQREKEARGGQHVRGHLLQAANVLHR
jgi:hypothetical protein